MTAPDLPVPAPSVGPTTECDAGKVALRVAAAITREKWRDDISEQLFTEMTGWVKRLLTIPDHHQIIPTEDSA